VLERTTDFSLGSHSDNLQQLRRGVPEIEVRRRNGSRTDRLAFGFLADVDEAISCTRDYNNQPAQAPHCSLVNPT